jgi:hypothetical protein
MHAQRTLIRRNRNRPKPRREQPLQHIRLHLRKFHEVKLYTPPPWHRHSCLCSWVPYAGFYRSILILSDPWTCSPKTKTAQPKGSTVHAAHCGTGTLACALGFPTAHKPFPYAGFLPFDSYTVRPLDLFSPKTKTAQPKGYAAVPLLPDFPLFPQLPSSYAAVESASLPSNCAKISRSVRINSSLDTLLFLNCNRNLNDSFSGSK